MLIVCRPKLAEEEFQRLAEKLRTVPFGLRWARRGGRLVIHLDRVRRGDAALDPIRSDPAVDYLLDDPSESEISRLFSRRDLIDLSLLSTGVLAAAAVLGPVAAYLTSRVGERSRRGDVYVGKADSIPVRGAVSKVIHGEEYLIIRRDETHFHALSATCTHSETCLVGWDTKRGQIVCPCHRGVYDIYGNVVSGPPPRPLARRNVTIKDGGVFVGPDQA